MNELDRITMDPRVMTGRPCIRGLRITVGTIIGLVAAGTSWAEIRGHYPEIEDEDIRQALATNPRHVRLRRLPIRPGYVREE